VTPNWVTDHLPPDMRYRLTGNYRTRAEIAEFEDGHYADFYTLQTGRGLVYLMDEDGKGFQKWTAHGWCRKCDALLAALPERPADK